MNLLKLIRSMFTAVPRVAAADGMARVRAGEAVLVDVREPSEWSRGIAELAVPLALSDLAGRRTKWRPFLAANADRELLLYCGAGVRSGMAARVLVKEGFRASNAGSLAEWTAAGWPVSRSTERR